jgi:hypothetical protein
LIDTRGDARDQSFFPCLDRLHTELSTQHFCSIRRLLHRRSAQERIHNVSQKRGSAFPGERRKVAPDLAPSSRPISILNLNTEQRPVAKAPERGHHRPLRARAKKQRPNAANRYERRDASVDVGHAIATSRSHPGRTRANPVSINTNRYR